MNINEILARNPRDLLALSEAELTSLLEPFFGPTRKSLLPPEKSRKVGLERRMIASYIEANKDLLKGMKK